MQELIGALALILAGALCLVAFFTVLSMLFPHRVARTRAIAASAPGRAFLAGLINFAFFGAIAAVLLAVSQGAQFLAVPGVLLAAALAGAICMGLAGAVQIVGERLRPQGGELARMAWGTLALALACLVPWVGWFLLLPYAALLGLGAFILGAVQREPPAEAWNAPAEETPPTVPQI